MLYDMRYMTHDRWKALCQNLRCLALTVRELWCFEDLEGKDDWINELINEIVTWVFVEQLRLHRVC